MTVPADTGFREIPFNYTSAGDRQVVAVTLDKRGKAAGIRAFAVHPGSIVATDANSARLAATCSFVPY